MTTISLKVPEALERRLKHLAAKRRTTRSAVIREAIEQFARSSADRVDSCLALASDLIGCVDGPPNLSHSKKHMQGFGHAW